MKRMKDVITQIRTWAVRLTALKERRHLYPIADEMKKEASRLEEGGYLIVSDLDTFEKCGLFDEEAQRIIDSDNMAFATDEDLGRKDEDGGVWTLAWVRVKKPVSPAHEDVLPWRNRIVRVKHAFRHNLPEGGQERPKGRVRWEVDRRAWPALRARRTRGEWPPQLLELCEDR